MDCYTAVKKNEMPFAATWMDLEMIILREVRHRRTNSILFHICGFFFLRHK